MTTAAANVNNDDEERCEFCGKRPAPVYAGDGGWATVWLCEECAADTQEEE